MKWEPENQVTIFDVLDSSVDGISKTEEVKKLRFLDLFAGIGGFRLGMEMAGHECVGFVEWDKYARKSYEVIHNTEGEFTAHDITTITDDDIRLLGTKGIDVICGGFPCQAFSVAGKRGGFDDTRGTLFFEIARIAKQIKPRILLLENVKGLLSHEQGRTFGTILNTLDELGYDCEWQVLNSKNFGVPQNRERVFIVGHLRGAGGREVFPIGGKNESVATEISRGQGIAYCLDANYSKGTSPGDIGKGRRTHLLIKEATKKGYTEAEIGDSVNYSIPTSKTRRGRVVKGIANTLDTGCQQGVVVEQEDLFGGLYVNDTPEFHRGALPGLSRTLKAQNHDAGVTDGLAIRKFTPRECFRLQGFPDHAFDKAQQVNSDSQLYKQAGNSVTVNVIHEIAKRL